METKKLHMNLSLPHLQSSSFRLSQRKLSLLGSQPQEILPLRSLPCPLLPKAQAAVAAHRQACVCVQPSLMLLPGNPCSGSPKPH